MTRSLASAGQGLAQRAEGRTKGMIGVGPSGAPLLDYQLAIAHRAGMCSVVLVIAEQSDAIRAHYGADDAPHAWHGLEIVYAVQHVPEGRTKPPGTADAVLCALDAHPSLLAREFIVCNSDNLYSREALDDLIALEGEGGMIAYDRAGLAFPHERIAQFGLVATNDDGRLTDIIEKPDPHLVQASEQRGVVRVSMNIWKFRTAEIRPALEMCPVDPIRNEKELPAAVRLMLHAHPGCLRAVPRCEHVPDLTSANDIARMDEWLRAEFPHGPWGESA